VKFFAPLIAERRGISTEGESLGLIAPAVQKRLFYSAEEKIRHAGGARHPCGFASGWNTRMDSGVRGM